MSTSDAVILFLCFVFGALVLSATVGAGIVGVAWYVGLLGMIAILTAISLVVAFISWAIKSDKIYKQKVKQTEMENAKNLRDWAWYKKQHPDLYNQQMIIQQQQKMIKHQEDWAGRVVAVVVIALFALMVLGTIL